MRTPIALLLLLIASAAPLGAQDAAALSPDSAWSLGSIEGAVTARSLGTGVWTVGGFTGGLLLGPVGAGLALAMASGSGSALPAAVVKKVGKRDADYQRGYQEAFSQKLVSRRRRSALAGGVAGTALLSAAVVLKVMGAR